jgi:sugar lactone lactonase YvrE
MDTAGNVYVADTSNQMVFKISPAGVLTIVAGNGVTGFSGDGGPATMASLNAPNGPVVDPAGNVYFADRSNHRIRRVDTAGVISTVAGSGTASFSGDGGPATAASLYYPRAVTIDAAGNLYIADQSNHRIRKVSSTTGIIATVAGTGVSGFSGDGGPATAAQLYSPAAALLDAAGNFYIADQSNNRIRKVAATGIITTVVGTGISGFSGDGGPATAAQVYSPWGLALDAAGNLYIADQYNYRIRKVDASGVIITVAGNGTTGYSGDGGAATAAQLASPSGVACDYAGNLYIADTNNYRVRKVSAAGAISTFAGNGLFKYDGDGGPATLAHLYAPQAVAVDAAGNLLIADTSNRRLRRMGTYGEITTIAGTGASGFAGDSGPATLALLSVYGVAADAAGNIFIADSSNVRVRKIGLDGVITTFAGGGSANPGDNGPATAASLSPTRVAVDGAGNLFIAESSRHRVRMVNTAGIITTVAGTGTAGYSGDGGPATSAQLNSPSAVAVDAAGNLYISDLGNQRIRKVSPGGTTIVTVAGSGVAGFSGDGGPATAASLNNPAGIAVDASGNIFVADRSNSRIRVVTPDAAITTVAGNDISGFSGDNGPATYASLRSPYGVFVDSAGNIYIADTSNDRVRKVTGLGYPSGVTVVSGNNQAASAGAALPNPLVVRVTNSSGAPVPGAMVNFAVVSGSATLSATSVAADSSGLAQVRVTLGNTAGSVVIAASTGSGLPAYFFATAVAGSPAFLGIVSGNNQAGSAGSTLPYPLTVRLVDQFSNPIAGVAVTFAITAGDGTLNPTFAATDNNGQARSAWTLGSISGTNAATASVPGLAAVTFTATVVLSIPAPVIATAAGDGLRLFGGDGGPATIAQLNSPNGGTSDPAGNFFFADTGNYRIRKVSPAGMITTVAGDGTYGFAGDGGAAITAQFRDPTGVALDANGNLYIADKSNNRIRKIDTNGMIATAAGSAASGYSGDGGAATAAALSSPNSVAVDPLGNLYIADSSNHRIRKVDTSGIITTVAGNGTRASSGDGGAATRAMLDTPYGVTVDGAGNLYISERSYRVRKVDSSGTITTIAGNGTSGSSGDAGLALNAQLSDARGLALDAVGNLFIVDGGYRIRMVTAGGVISTVAGNGGGGFWGDGGPATAAFLGNAQGAWVGPANSLYIADTNNNRIREVTGLPSQNAVTVKAVQAQPGTTARIPVTLRLNGGVFVDSLAFSLTLTPNGSAPVLSNALSFQQDAAMRTPTSVGNPGGANFITVTWQNLGTLGATAKLGDVLASIPATASSGQSYTFRITSVTAMFMGTAVPLMWGGDAAATVTATNPVPSLATLSPATATAGGSAFTLTVTGTNFISTSVVRWNGADRATTFVSSTQLTAAISAADVAAAGTASVYVFNPAPGGGLSGWLNFTVTSLNPAPTVTSLLPSSAAAGSAGFALTVNGTGFISASVVRWNGADRATTFVSGTQLTAAISAADVAAAGTALVAVLNPAPGGGLSTPLHFDVTSLNPAPTVTSLLPPGAAAGSAGFALTVNGTGFVSGSVVRWNGADRTTTFVSGTQLTAAITAADIATAGTAQVTVFNPAPGGGVSNTVPLTIVFPNPVPSVTSLSPASTTAGGAAFTLTVNGTGFTSASVVRWNGTDRATTFSSSIQLLAAIPATDITTEGTVQVTVWNPAPGGGTSNAVSFSITAITPAAIVKVSGDGQSGVVGTALANPLVVQVNGAAGSGIPGVVVTFAVTSGSATLSVQTAVTNNAGQAQVTVTLGALTGAVTVNASVSGVSAPAVFSAAAVAAPPASLAIISGNNQTASVGSTLPSPLVLRVTDQYGNPVSAASVNFAVTGGSGALSAASVTTASDGRAQTTLTLGTTPGAVAVSASVAGVATPAVFTAAATPGPPALLVTVSGYNQTGTVGTALTQPLVVRVMDQYGNPLAGVAVSFTVTAGGGSLNVSNNVTNSSGQAEAVLTLGTVVGTVNVSASVSGVSAPVVFTSVAAAGPPASLAIVSGNNQRGFANAMLPNPLVVKVADQYGNPAPNVTLNFAVTSGGGHLSGNSAVTNVSGQAQVTWTLGIAEGVNTAQASTGSLAPVNFTATAIASTMATGLLTVGDAAGPPGGTARIPLTLIMNSGATVDSVTVGVQVVANSKAPDLSGTLSFAKDAGIQDPSLVDSGAALNAISITWLSLPTVLSGTVRLGEVIVTIPTKANNGETYTVRITGANGSQGATNMPLLAGANATVSVGRSYLAGDVFPLVSALGDLDGDNDTDDAGEFGDTQLNTLDLIHALRAVTNMPGFRPPACSDRFDAMDSYPPDTSNARGGDGVLNTLDLIVTLRRVTNIDASRPARLSRGLACPASAASVGAMAARKSEQAAAREAAAAEAIEAVEFGSPVALTGDVLRVPLYLRARREPVLAGLSLALGLEREGTERLRFVSAESGAPSLVDEGLPGRLAVAWLARLPLNADGPTLLGWVEIAGWRDGQPVSAPLRIYGLDVSIQVDDSTTAEPSSAVPTRRLPRIE